MLVLARKKGESIIIGDQIELVVLGVEGDVVKLGIQAPKKVQVYRKEIYDAIKENNREASSQSLDMESLNKLYKKE
ncbi:carbon storage regulator CsrA [Paenibacillus radicis (ex Xue et al. 2023)]|uniref:Translational regulator CsrA n=1 Tax=Paenibacillus radicis (ex Xue et al. 2023) TaxID=2972489 RepID=A0ABT1YK62_9BACL|nr:carbon storage regulator CsrA [Paenibacillus radicis (ex Xue et al. 2023)]MCR8632370.1 carbon storage regulator CsrA [Paenibacillus radicis (ex Xue et al. 2023)]